MHSRNGITASTEGEHMSFYSETLNYEKVKEIANGINTIDLNATDILKDPLEAAAVALYIYNNKEISTDALTAAASHRKEICRGKNIVGFVPIYLTNHCDGECKMCGMRTNNSELVRQFSSKTMIDKQLKFLYEEQHMRGVAFLTGEYNDGFSRSANAFIVGYALRRALDYGFESVYMNIGSLQPKYISIIADFIEKEDYPRVAMCVNQETYNEQVYSRFMSDQGDAFKANFKNRIDSHDSWSSLGFVSHQIGSLLGVNRNVGEEVAGLVAHGKYLMSKTAKNIFFSLPRLNPALGASGLKRRKIVDEDALIRIIAILAFVSPESSVMMTTRENSKLQDKVIPLLGCLAPGTPEVGAYLNDPKKMPNDETLAQFKISDTRMPRDIFEHVESSTDFTISDFISVGHRASPMQVSI
jgi:3-methyl-2-indolic acid synthase